MEDREIVLMLKSYDVPQELYKAKRQDFTTPLFQTLIDEYLEDIHSKLRKGESLYITALKPEMASQFAVYILKLAYKNDYLNAAYVTPFILAGRMTTSWDGDETYDFWSAFDLIIVDEVFRKNLDTFKLKTLSLFLYKRLLNDKATIVISDAKPSDLLPQNVVSAMRGHENVKLVSLGGDNEER